MLTFSQKIINDTKRDISILIVDDDPLVLRAISKILEISDENYFIETATTVEELLSLVGKTYWIPFFWIFHFPIMKATLRTRKMDCLLLMF